MPFNESDCEPGNILYGDLFVGSVDGCLNSAQLQELADAAVLGACCFSLLVFVLYVVQSIKHHGGLALRLASVKACVTFAAFASSLLVLQSLRWVALRRWEDDVLYYRGFHLGFTLATVGVAEMFFAGAWLCVVAHLEYFQVAFDSDATRSAVSACVRRVKLVVFVGLASLQIPLASLIVSCIVDDPRASRNLMRYVPLTFIVCLTLTQAFATYAIFKVNLVLSLHPVTKKDGESQEYAEQRSKVAVDLRRGVVVNAVTIVLTPWLVFMAYFTLELWASMAHFLSIVLVIANIIAVTQYVSFMPTSKAVETNPRTLVVGRDGA